MGAVTGHERFERLFDSQFSRCVHVANKIVRDRAVAEEVASEAFARAWSRWNRLSRDHRADGWVLRVTVNLAIDTTRKRTVQPELPLPALSTADAATLHVALVQALQALPRRQREAIVLRYLADLSESDVSAALGVSAGSVKTHLHRGMARLRTTLGPDDDVEVRLVHGT
jgi:RNA polymerase sigma-70 factor (sigma-E family)